MRLVKTYFSDEKIPNDKELEQCISIAESDNCIVRLEWFFPYSGKYSVDIVKGMSVEDVKSKMPKCYFL